MPAITWTVQHAHAITENGAYRLAVWGPKALAAKEGWATSTENAYPHLPYHAMLNDQSGVVFQGRYPTYAEAVQACEDQFGDLSLGTK